MLISGLRHHPGVPGPLPDERPHRARHRRLRLLRRHLRGEGLPPLRMDGGGRRGALRGMYHARVQDTPQ